jgi:hypothetical protein
MSDIVAAASLVSAAMEGEQIVERPMFVNGLTKEEEEMTDTERISYLREVYVLLMCLFPRQFYVYIHDNDIQPW